jgi:hypothetical protein
MRSARVVIARISNLLVGLFCLHSLSYVHQSVALAQTEDYVRGLKRAQFLLNGRIPTDDDFATGAANRDAYAGAVRNLLNQPQFYDAVLRYHQRVFGIGLPIDYLQELQREDIDGKARKFARIICGREARDGRFRCTWSNDENSRQQRNDYCPASWEEPVAAFWRPNLAVWVCPSVARTCGSDLSRCFIESVDEDQARNSELGTSEVYDSRFTIIKSLANQAAGIATAVAVENYPYTSILEPGLTAVDGAIANFYRQSSHFNLDALKLPKAMLDQLESIKVGDTRFNLIYSGDAYEQAGVLSTFGFLRRYEKNRTRANNAYERLLCRKFTAELPRVFPQDPGNLRETPGCSGCHATLDPLADFFLVWGEGGALYDAPGQPVQTTFGGKTGTYLSDLANIIRSDRAFATCTVQHVWSWMIGREFYTDEEPVRTALTEYFVATDYSFKELVYALATHPVFLNPERQDATVTDPLTQPPLGEAPDAVAEPECGSEPISFTPTISSQIGQCSSCHTAGTSRRPLVTEQDWLDYGSTAVGLMRSGDMPPGQTGPPRVGPVWELKEAVRCWLEQQNQ